jgi:phosphohistidine swiveling domain-containing protein
MQYQGKNHQIIDLVREFSGQERWKNLIIVDSPEQIDKKCSQNYLLVTDQIHSEQLVELLFINKVSHVVQLSNADFKKSFERAATLITEGAKILADPVGTIIKSPYPNQLRLPMTSGIDKDVELQKVRDYLSAVPQGDTVQESGLIIAHELMTNVLYDAPRIYKELFPQEALNISPSQVMGEILIAYNDKKILVGAVDRFGSLAVEKLIGRLHETYQSSMVSVRLDSNGGAGIGCRMIFDLSTQLYFSVDRGNKTFVGACLPLGMSYKKQQLTPKNVHIIEIKNK